jgi:hypothetical protein
LKEATKENADKFTKSHQGKVLPFEQHLFPGGIRLGGAFFTPQGEHKCKTDPSDKRFYPVFPSFFLTEKGNPFINDRLRCLDRLG